MKIEDLSPPSIPTREQQRDALQKGLGRAVQWAISGLLEKDLLLNACLVDQRFDIQCEDNRGEWLWSLTQRMGQQEAFRCPILEAIQNVTVERDSYQLCELAFHFAKSGDNEFLKSLYRFVEQNRFAASPDIGVRQLLELEGETAFEFVIKVRGKKFISEDWEWCDDSLTEQATELFGAARVTQILGETSDLDAQRFAERWRVHVAKLLSSESAAHQRVHRAQSASVEEVLQNARSDESSHWLPFWGEKAIETNLDEILESLWDEKRPAVIQKLLRVFARRPLPEFDPRLIALCQHDDADVCRRALQALAQIKHAAVREFALQELSQPTASWPVVGLLVKNFVKGDESLLLAGIELPEDLFIRHDLLMDLRNILEENDDAKVLELGLAIYFHTPCQECRFYALSLLDAENCVPEWLNEERGLDANEECRLIDDASVEDPADNPET